MSLAPATESCQRRLKIPPEQPAEPGLKRAMIVDAAPKRRLTAIAQLADTRWVCEG